jgi:hypothetical protein
MRKTAKVVRRTVFFGVFVGALALLMVTPFAQAQQPMDMMSCGDSTVTTIVASEELTIMGIEGRGINVVNFSDCNH